MSVRLRRIAGQGIALMLAMAAVACSPPGTTDSTSAFIYADLPDGDTLCARIPIVQLARSAAWSLERESIHTDGPIDTGLSLIGGCRFTARSESDTPLDGGELYLEVATAADVPGVARTLEQLSRSGDYDEDFAAFGSYEKQEIPIEGWWSKGSARMYTQDFSGTAVVTRVLVTAQISDANVTASILVKSMITGDSPADLERLKTLVTDTLLALHGALDRRAGA